MKTATKFKDRKESKPICLVLGFFHKNEQKDLPTFCPKAAIAKGQKVGRNEDKAICF